MNDNRVTDVLQRGRRRNDFVVDVGAGLTFDSFVASDQKDSADGDFSDQDNNVSCDGLIKQ
jgi:hypothetical protein